MKRPAGSPGLVDTFAIPASTPASIPASILVSILASILTLAVQAGCRPDFAPYNRLTSLRVLAIQSDPPTPATGETTMLSALVFTPAADPAAPVPVTVTYAWSWCPFPGAANDGHPCLLTEDQVTAFEAMYGVTGQVPPFDLGAAPTAMLPNTIDPMLLTALCAGVPGAPQAPDCNGGFPVQVALSVTSFDDSGTQTDQVNAVFTVRLRFDGGPTAPYSLSTPNAIPMIGAGGITATIAGVPTAIPGLDAAATAPITLPRDTATALAADVAETEAEVYDGLDDDGNPATITERLFLTWFVETGVTDQSRTSFIDGSTSFPDLLTNTWTPQRFKDYSKPDARIIVVIHDSRGGVSWQNGIGIVHLESTP